MKFDDAIINWLTELENPSVRYLTLKKVLKLDDKDPELIKARKEAIKNGVIAEILANMHPDGYWVKPGAGYSPKYKSTVWSLIALSQLGASVEDDERINKACQYYLDHAFCEGGYISCNGSPSVTIDCLQGNMCAALTLLGVKDTRLHEAYEWMARSVTGEGVGPAGSKNSDRHYFAYKCGPCFACGVNAKLPCAWGAVKVMLAFSVLPKSKRTKLIDQAIKVGVDFLLAQDIESATYPTREGTPPNKSWWKLGFPVFYVTDILQIVEVLVNLGYKKDPNVQKAIKRILSMQDKEGRWLLEYNLTGKTQVDFGEMHKPNKFVTYRVYKNLAAC